MRFVHLRRLVMAALLTAMAGTVAYGFALVTVFNWYHIYEPVQLYRNLEFAVFSAIALYGLVEFAIALRDTVKGAQGKVDR